MADSDGIEPHRTGEVRRETVALRRLRMSDAAAVHKAFASAGDMARQGDVTTAEGAERYVARLLEAGSSHEAWAIVEADELIGLIGVTVDEENRSGWFWYWMTHRARTRPHPPCGRDRRGMGARRARQVPHRRAAHRRRDLRPAAGGSGTRVRHPAPAHRSVSAPGGVGDRAMSAASTAGHRRTSSGIEATCSAAFGMSETSASAVETG